MKKYLCILLALLCLLSLPAMAEETDGVWTTSNPAVAWVDGYGNVTAVGVGEADVSYTDADGNTTVTRVIVTDLSCPGCGEYVNESNAADHALCLSCGLHACQEGYGALDHKTILSAFCDLEYQHRACAADSMHYCDDCESEYECRLSGNHAKCIKCGLAWCDKTTRGSHAAPDCGDDDHRPCVLGSSFDEDDHEWCGYCRKYKCKVSGKVKHGDGEGECGYKEPAEEKCPGCGEAGVQHAEKCEVCEELYCNPDWLHHNDCDHCYKKSAAHGHAWCGRCDDGFICWGDHGNCSRPEPEILCSGCDAVLESADAHKLSCGHYSCKGGEHGSCAHCGMPLCNGDSHGTGEGQCAYIDCSFCAAPDVQHDEAACGKHCVNQQSEHEECWSCDGWLCDGDNHDGMACDHCPQRSGDHTYCEYCEGWKCHPSESGLPHGGGEGQCGYFEPSPCDYCNEPGITHNAALCNEHCVEQSGQHERCDHCNEWLCLTTSVSHGTGEGQCGYVAS